MSDIILSGQITAVMPLQQGVSQKTGQPWVSQDYLLTYEGGQYPKSICFKVFGQDKIQQFAIQQGEQLTIHLNITAKKGQKGYFNDIDCWKVDRLVQQQYAQPMAPQYQPAPTAYAPFPPQPTTSAPQQTTQGQPMGGQLPFPPAQ